MTYELKKGRNQSWLHQKFLSFIGTIKGSYVLYFTQESFEQRIDYTLRVNGDAGVGFDPAQETDSSAESIG